MANYTLGLSCYYHDSAVCLIKDGEIVSALQEERFSRLKNDAGFPHLALKALIEQNDINPHDIDLVVYYEKPFLTFERLLETYHATWPRSLKSFLKVMPLWVKEKIFLKSTLKDELAEHEIENYQLTFPEHHHSHMASAFYPSPYDQAAILTLDGVGEWKTMTLAKGQGTDITLLAHQEFPHSLGLFYSAFTAFCGFRVNNGEYKLMGLAPYAKKYSDRASYYEELILKHLIVINGDGSFKLNLDYFHADSAFDLVNTQAWEELFSLKRLPLESQLEKEHACLALACQKITEEIILKLLKTLKGLTKLNHLCLSGGVALNSVANGLIANSKVFESVWIQPAAGDAGSALGAAYIGEYLIKKNKRLSNGTDAMKGSLLGTQYNDVLIKEVINTIDLTLYDIKYFESIEEMLTQASIDLHEDHILGWFQGRMEFGPRSLGNRSILANPSHLENQMRVNQKVKKRESFRPFAPALLSQDYPALFGNQQSSPYMQFVHPLKDEVTTEQVTTASYQALPSFIKEQLSLSNSPYPAITHVDRTCRVQVVDPLSQPLFHDLLICCKERMGTGVLLNTSFNVKGEPIVESPLDAFNCFENTDIDILYLGKIRIRKK